MVLCNIVSFQGKKMLLLFDRNQKVYSSWIKPSQCQKPQPTKETKFSLQKSKLTQYKMGKRKDHLTFNQCFN